MARVRLEVRIGGPVAQCERCIQMAVKGRKRPGTSSSPELATWRGRDPQWETGGGRLHGTLVMDNSRPDNPPGAIEEKNQ